MITNNSCSSNESSEERPRPMKDKAPHLVTWNEPNSGKTGFLYIEEKGTLKSMSINLSFAAMFPVLVTWS